MGERSEDGASWFQQWIRDPKVDMRVASRLEKAAGIPETNLPPNVKAFRQALEAWLDMHEENIQYEFIAKLRASHVTSWQGLAEAANEDMHTLRLFLDHSFQTSDGEECARVSRVIKLLCDKLNTLPESAAHDLSVDHSLIKQAGKALQADVIPLQESFIRASEQFLAPPAPKPRMLF